MVHTYLHSVLEARTGADRKSYWKVLSDAFKIEPGTLQAVVPGYGDKTATLTLRRWLAWATPAECSALLAALDIDFSTARHGFAAQTLNSRMDTKVIGMAIESMTVKSARKELVHRMAINSRSSAHRQLWWFLRIHDYAWLGRQFPRRVRGYTLPPISDDRRDILRIFENDDLQLGQRLKSAMDRTSSVRARSRDAAWYREQCERLREKATSALCTGKASVRISRIGMVQDAIQRIVASEGRPRLIRASMIAEIAGLSAGQVHLVMQASLQLQTTVAALNEDKRRRQALWAVRQLRAEGVTLTKSAIAKLAGLPTNKIVNSWLQ